MRGDSHGSDVKQPATGGIFREQVVSKVLLTKRTGEHTGSDFDHVLLMHGQTREGLLPVVAQFFITERGRVYFSIDNTDWVDKVLINNEMIITFWKTP